MSGAARSSRRERQPATSPRTPFPIDLVVGQMTCPARHTVDLARDGQGRVARFTPACGSCPLAAQCTTAEGGRSVHVGPYEAQLAAARREQTTPAWQADYRATRPKVERNLAYLLRRLHGGRRARVRGQPKVAADFAVLAAAVNRAAWPYSGSWVWPEAGRYAPPEGPARPICPVALPLRPLHVTARQARTPEIYVERPAGPFPGDFQLGEPYATPAS